MQEVEVKGSNFTSVVEVLDELRGAAFRERVIARMPGESGQALALGAVIRSGWYPVRWYRELFGAIVSVEGTPLIAREIGRTSLRREITSLHQLIFRVLTFATIQNQAARVFRMYFRPAEVQIRMIDEDRAWTRYHECHGFDRNLWQEQLGGAEELLLRAGAKRVYQKVLEGGGDGDSYMEIESRWR